MRNVSNFERGGAAVASPDAEDEADFEARTGIGSRLDRSSDALGRNPNEADRLLEQAYEAKFSKERARNEAGPEKVVSHHDKQWALQTAMQAGEVGAYVGVGKSTTAEALVDNRWEEMKLQAELERRASDPKFQAEKKRFEKFPELGEVYTKIDGVEDHIPVKIAKTGLLGFRKSHLVDPKSGVRFELPAHTDGYDRIEIIDGDIIGFRTETDNEGNTHRIEAQLSASTGREISSNPHDMRNGRHFDDVAAERGAKVYKNGKIVNEIKRKK